MSLKMKFEADFAESHHGRPLELLAETGTSVRQSCDCRTVCFCPTAESRCRRQLLEVVSLLPANNQQGQAELCIHGFH